MSAHEFHVSITFSTWRVVLVAHLLRLAFFVPIRRRLAIFERVILWGYRFRVDGERTWRRVERRHLDGALLAVVSL